MDLYYVVNKTKLYTLIEEEVSKVADEAYAEGGQSLYDSIILTEKDRSTVERFMEDALNAFVAREDSISAYSPLVEIDENENEVVTPRLELNLPDFDSSRWLAAQSELDRYVTLSVCSGIFQSRRADKVEEYSARALAAMEKAVSLLKKRMVRTSAPSGGGLTPEQEEKLNSLPTASELEEYLIEKQDVAAKSTWVYGGGKDYLIIKAEYQSPLLIFILFKTNNSGLNNQTSLLLLAPKIYGGGVIIGYDAALDAGMARDGGVYVNFGRLSGISEADVYLFNYNGNSLSNVEFLENCSSVGNIIIRKYQPVLTFDEVPTENSNNPVKSGGVFSSLKKKADASAIADYDSIIGIGSAITLFDPLVPYQKNEFVLHLDLVSGRLRAYQFTQYHPAGAWTGNDVTIANIYNIFANYAGTDVEKVYVQIASSDGLLTLEGIEVTANFSDGGIETKEADENGRCVFEIAKGRVYTISVEQKGGQGYAFCPAQMGKAVADDRYMYFEYSKIGGGYCVVKVYAYTYGERPADFSDSEGKQVQIALSDDTLQSMPFDANGIATFPSVPQNVTGTIVCPKVAGYYTPKNLTILTGFSEQNINANYSSLSTPGIYFTLSDETDVDSSAITAEQLANVIAIHVATEELVDAESDFYVRPSDLWATTTKTNYRWCEPNPNGQYPACPNVPIWNADSPYYNGKVASASMFSDLLAADTYSKNLDFAMAETLVTENRTVNGFLPTRDQFQVLVDNYESINGMLQQIDATKSATYRQRSWWMATNHTNTGVAWIWTGGSWNNNLKNYNYASWFPFFAI